LEEAEGEKGAVRCVSKSAYGGSEDGLERGTRSSWKTYLERGR